MRKTSLLYELCQQLLGDAASQGNTVTGIGYDDTVAAVMQHLHLGSHTQAQSQETPRYLLSSLDLNDTRSFPFRDKA